MLCIMRLESTMAGQRRLVTHSTAPSFLPPVSGRELAGGVHQVESRGIGDLEPFTVVKVVGMMAANKVHTREVEQSGAIRDGSSVRPSLLGPRVGCFRARGAPP